MQLGDFNITCFISVHVSTSSYIRTCLFTLKCFIYMYVQECNLFLFESFGIPFIPDDTPLLLYLYLGHTIENVNADLPAAEETSERLYIRHINIMCAYCMLHMCSQDDTIHTR